jgi:hypothetical protein
LKVERFDRDPGWDARNNRIPPKPGLVVRQDFGCSATHFAGKAAGEMGGRIQRSATPASYAAPLAPAKTLDDKLSAAGSFAITSSQPGAGVFFGFFNSRQPGGSGRPIGSLSMNFDFEREGAGWRCGSSRAATARPGVCDSRPEAGLESARCQPGSVRPVHRHRRRTAGEDFLRRPGIHHPPWEVAGHAAQRGKRGKEPGEAEKTLPGPGE